MGEVYLAEDTKLNRKVALKFLPVDVSPSRERRFLQEARAAAKLHHGNIAHIYEIGEAGGKTFIAMEYVDGEGLETKIKGRALETDEIIRVGIDVAAALDAAHSAGITHRDIKPANIMLSSRGHVKVLDFGLAKLTSPRSEETGSDASTQIKTSPGVLLGTFAYMSPEQALGHDVDHRSDIFSLGLTLYEMATAKRPFSGATPTQTLDQILHAQPEAVTNFNESIPLELERIISKCLEKDRHCRYQSARELLTDLRNLQRDRTRTSLVNTDRARPQRPVWVRRPAVYILLAMAVLAVVWIVAFRSKTESTAINSIAVLPFTDPSTDSSLEYISDGITENLINRLSQLPELRVVPRSTVFRYRGQNVDAQKAARDLGVRAVIVGRVVQRGDTLNIQAELIDVANEAQLWGEQYNRRLTDLITIQEEIATSIAEKLRQRLSETDRQRLTRRYTQSNEAYELYLRGRYFWNKRSENGMRKAIECYRQASDIDPNYALAYVGLADAYNFLGAFGIAVLPPSDAMPKAKSAAMKALEIDGSLAEAHTSLAFVNLYYDWNWAEAEKAFRRAIELNPNYAPAHQWYSHLLMAAGRTNESISEAKRAMEIDPLSQPANMNLGWQYHWARQSDSAIEQLQKTLEMDQNFEQGHWGLGLAYELGGKFEEAVAEFQRAVTLSGDHAVYVAALGHAYAAGNRKLDAARIRDELENRSKGSYVPPYWIATLHAGLGDKDEAFRWLDKAHAERSGGLVWLRVDPRMDSLRSDLRFARLVKRVELQ